MSAQPDRRGYARVCFVVSSPMTLQAFVAPHIAAMHGRYAVSVVANADTGAAPPMGSDVEFISLPIERRIAPLRDAWAFARLARLIQRSRFSAVQSVTPKAGLIAMAAACACRVPVRIHFFTGQVWVTRRGVARWLLKLADRMIALLATHVLVDSGSQRDFLIENGIVSAEKSRVLGKGSISGVDVTRFKPDANARARLREQLGFDHAAVIFVYVGRLNRDKGMLDLAAAFARIAGRAQDARLLVVGPDEDRMRARMEEILGAASAAARFVPYTMRPEDHMAAADVFCLPSYREGFGSTVIEAAACGIPAIGSRIYGITDAIEENATGLLFEPGDAAGLAECMMRLAADTGFRLALGERARTRAVRDFRADLVVGELLRFYASVMGPDGR